MGGVGRSERTRARNFDEKGGAWKSEDEDELSFADELIWGLWLFCRLGLPRRGGGERGCCGGSGVWLSGLEVRKVRGEKLGVCPTRRVSRLTPPPHTPARPGCFGARSLGASLEESGGLLGCNKPGESRARGGGGDPAGARQLDVRVPCPHPARRLCACPRA